MCKPDDSGPRGNPNKYRRAARRYPGSLRLSASFYLLSCFRCIFCVSSQNQKGPSPALSATKPATHNQPLALVAATLASSVKVPTTQPPIDPNDQGIYIAALGAENYEFSLDCGEHGGVIDNITVPNFDLMFFSLLVRCEMRQTYFFHPPVCFVRCA